MKRLGLLGVLALTVGCATTQKQVKPKLTEGEIRDSMLLWYGIAKDYLIKAQDKGSQEALSTYERALVNYRKALYYSSMIPKDTLHILILLEIAYAHLKTNNTDSAEVYYRKAIQADSSDYRGWLGLGSLYTLRGDVASAREFYTKAFELEPENPDVLFALARVYEKEGKVEEAEKLYTDALKKNPDSYGLNKSYGEFLMEMKRYSEAVGYLKRAYEAAKKKVAEEGADEKLIWKVLPKLVEAYSKSKGLDTTSLKEGLRFADELISKDSTKSKYFMWRAKIYEKLGQLDKAISDYEKTISMNPKAKILYVRIAELYRKQGNLSKAEEYAKKVTTDKEIEEGYRGHAWMIIGEVRKRRAMNAYKKRRYKEAVAHFDSAIAAYEQAHLLLEGSHKDYASKQLNYLRKMRKKAWRRWKKID